MRQKPFLVLNRSLHRQTERFMVSHKIHGGSQNSTVPGAIGLIDTALRKCSTNLLVDVMSSNKKINQHVFPIMYKSHLSVYESLAENMMRSISTYYSGGIVGKQKYRKVYKDSCYKTRSSSKNRVRLCINDCPIPRLVPYHKLMNFIKSVPVGKLYIVYSTHCLQQSS